MQKNGHKDLYVINLGLTKYKEVWDLQKRLVNLRADNKIPDTLLLTEHEPVITMGRSNSNHNLLIPRAELKNRGIEYYQIERGGDITCHSPGQLVAYPIINLNDRGRDLHQYLRDLEQVVMDTLAELGIKASTRKGMTGAWVESFKLAAIGVAVSRWVSYHGLALNVENDLDFFKLINPCGITQFPIGSVSSISGKNVKVETVSKILVGKFAELFGYKSKNISDIEELMQRLVAA